MIDLDFGSDFLGGLDDPDEEALETRRSIKRVLRHDRQAIKRERIRALHGENLSDLFPELPPAGTTCHIVNNGKTDFWAICPHLIKLTGPAHLAASTWTMNRRNVLEMLEMFDRRQILSVEIITGTYFKHREPAVYATLAEGLLARGQRLLAFENHAKILAITNERFAIVVEGSANFTANPRVEQYCLTHDMALAEFHREWIGDMLRDGEAKPGRGRGWRPT